jgi:hypothetical protein
MGAHESVEPGDWRAPASWTGRLLSKQPRNRNDETVTPRLRWVRSVFNNTKVLQETTEQLRAA